MKAEIIAIGTEVLMGQVINTNAAYISERLSELGIDVFYHTVVGDNPSRMQAVIQQALSRSDLIILSGGLGPTKDDISKTIVAETLGLELIEDDESLEEIRDFYKKSNRSMPQSNLNQALMIETGQKIPNDTGMAPGVFLKHGDNLIAMVPGVPSEMKHMVSHHLMDLLQNELSEKSILHSKTLRLYKIAESQLAENIDDLIEQQTNPTIAIYVTGFEPTIRISAKADTLEHAQELIAETEGKIRNLVGDHIYGEGDQSITDKVCAMLADEQVTLNIVESQVNSLMSSVMLNNGDKANLVQSVMSFNNHDKLKTFYGLGDLTQSNLEGLLKNQASQLGANAALLVLGDQSPHKSYSSVSKIDVYFMLHQTLHVFKVDLSYRKVITDRMIEVGLMHTLYDLLK